RVSREGNPPGVQQPDFDEDALTAHRPMGALTARRSSGRADGKALRHKTPILQIHIAAQPQQRPVTGSAAELPHEVLRCAATYADVAAMDGAVMVLAHGSQVPVEVGAALRTE